jgi:hypothetical protein
MDAELRSWFNVSGNGLLVVTEVNTRMAGCVGSRETTLAEP